MDIYIYVWVYIYGYIHIYPDTLSIHFKSICFTFFRKFSQRICRRSGIAPCSNTKPGRHLPPNHPLLIRVQEWVQLNVESGKYNGRLIANFDQVWSVCFNPARRTLQKKRVFFDQYAKNLSYRRVRHCIERCLGQSYTESMEESAMNATRLQGGEASHCPVDGWRVPRTLTTLSWSDGSLGRGYVSCSQTGITEQERRAANKEHGLKPVLCSENIPKSVRQGREFMQLECL